MITFGMKKMIFIRRTLCIRMDATTYTLYCRGESIGQDSAECSRRPQYPQQPVGDCRRNRIGCTPKQAAESASAFQGAGRRFEIMGENKGVTIADDYGPAPAELEVTLKAAKAMEYRQVWAVHQPFTYSRTAMLLDDFARVLQLADHGAFGDSGSEKNTYPSMPRTLRTRFRAVWFPTLRRISPVMSHAQPGSLFITMGCGDISRCAKLMLAEK